MSSKFLSFFLVLIALLSLSKAKGQCSGGTSAGTITPTSSFQISCLKGGRYNSFSAIQGGVYIFTFCQGGASHSFDTELTILTSTGAIVAGTYNDDYCSLGSEITFTAPATATYRIYLTEYSCASNNTCQNMAYKYVVPTNDNICSATFVYGYSCSANYRTFTNTYSTNSSQAAPSCGSYNGKDVWIATRMPSSGRLRFTAQAVAGSPLVDGAMAVYKGSCNGTLTQVACDDDALGASGMPQIDITSGVNPGDTLFVRFWEYGGVNSGSFKIAIYDLLPNYCMAGQASELTPSNCVEVTPNQPGQAGCVWNTTRLDLNNTLDYTYSVNLGSSDAGADGITFTLQNSPAGSSACGNGGYQLASSPIPNSLAVEFDTYDNGGASELVADHTAISVNGDILTPVVGPIQASASSSNIEDGLEHAVRVTWNPATYVFSVYFDGVFRLSYTNDIINNLFSGSNLVYWGFTGSTGGYTNSQVMCPGNLPGAPLPVQWLSFDVHVLNQHAYLNWRTEYEKNIYTYEIERSTDGFSFNVIGTRLPQGTGGFGNYQFTDTEPLDGISYYRIKESDLTGKTYYSIIRTINNSPDEAGFFHLYPNPVSSGTEIFVDMTEDGSIEIYDRIGNSVHKQSLTAGVNSINIASINSGVYSCVIKKSNSAEAAQLVVSQ